jgi:hypothetical protein
VYRMGLAMVFVWAAGVRLPGPGLALVPNQLNPALNRSGLFILYCPCRFLPLLCPARDSLGRDGLSPLAVYGFSVTD